MISTVSATEQNISTDDTTPTDQIIQGTVSESNMEINEANYKNINKQSIKNNKEDNAEISNKKNTTISIDSLNYGKYGENLSISGKLTEKDNDKVLSDSKVNIILNNDNYFKKTDNKGIFVFSKKITKIGKNNVTVRFDGNNDFNGDEKNIIFNVEKQDVIVTYDTIQSVKYKDNVTITGKITDRNKNPLYNINALITINSKLYKAKTDKTGAFTLTATATNIGTNDVTIAYSGND